MVAKGEKSLIDNEARLSIPIVQKGPEKNIVDGAAETIVSGITHVVTGAAHLVLKKPINAVEIDLDLRGIINKLRLKNAVED